VTELRLPTDYEDFLRELVDGGVDFVLVGGWAMAAHGHGRATDDMDVLVRATPDNAERVMEALHRFGAPLAAHGVNAGLFAQERYGYRMGRKPLLIELLTTIDGVTFDQAQEGAITVRVGGIAVPVIGRSALIANKRAAGRPKDLADLEVLESVR